MIIGDGKNNYLEFEKNFVETLNKHDPKKTKIFRGNHKTHISKTLRKAIMKRSQLKNKANKTKDPKDILKYEKQRNYVVKLNNQSKQEHFDSLNPFLDSKPFWKSCKPYFSNKHSFGESKIALNESGEVLTENMKTAKTFNSYFKSVTDSLELFDWPLQSNGSCVKVQNIIKRFSNHPSIIKIKHKFNLNKKSSFQCVSEATVRKVVKSFLSDKATAGEIPINVLKNCENCFFDLTNCINKAIRSNKFPDSLKLSDITPVFRKLDPSGKANYRPVSVLPLSKVFEKIIYDQLYEYLENFLSELLSGFRKAHSTQHALFRLIQKWQADLDSGGYVGTILMDLSKAYDCLSHDLLIAKLED